MQQNLDSESRPDILIVDDLPDNIRLLASILVERGYNVRKALNGQMALTAAQTVPPDLILLDINMPEMNGYEVCQKLKKNSRTSSIPVIFLSALDDVIDKVQAFKVGGIDFITKPFYFEEVCIRIQTQLTIRNLQLQLKAQNAKLQQALDYLRITQSMLPLRKEVGGDGQITEFERQNDSSISYTFDNINLTSVREYIYKLLNIISTYQKEYPNPTPIVKQALDEVDLSSILNLQKLAQSE